MFEKGAIPLINRPTRVTASSATLLNNIFTNCIFDTSLKNATIKTSIPYHFAIFTGIKMKILETKKKKLKRYFLVIRTKKVLNRIYK